MPMNEEVRKAVEYCDRSAEDSPYDESDWYLVRAYLMQQDAELTRLTEIADGVDPLVVRLGEVTEKLERANAWNERVSVCRNHTADVIDGTCLVCRLEAANALLRDIKEWDVNAAQGTCLMVPHSLRSRIQAHLSEPRT